MSGRPKQPKYARNKNILVIGGSGSGKTRFFVKPNLMQMHSSYVVTDPKGTVLVECGKMLLKNGYKVKVLNIINLKNQCTTILSLISGVKAERIERTAEMKGVAYDRKQTEQK